HRAGGDGEEEAVHGADHDGQDEGDVVLRRDPGPLPPDGGVAGPDLDVAGRHAPAQEEDEEEEEPEERPPQGEAQLEAVDRAEAGEAVHRTAPAAAASSSSAGAAAGCISRR